MSAPTTKRIPAGAATPNGDRTNINLGVGLNVGTSVPQDTDIPTLNTMNARGQRVATAYYEAGVLAGIEMGRQQAEAEMEQLWSRARAIVLQAAKQPDYAVLADRRGEPERARRQRELLQRRGLAA